MANVTISDLTNAASVVSTDILEIETDPGGTPASRKATVSVLATAIAPRATAAEYRSAAAGKVIEPDDAWSAAGFVSLTDAATVAVDLSTGFNFTLAIGGNRTLGNPTNTKDGQSGVIVITQDGTGSRTLAYASNWEFASGTAPVLSTAAGAKDVLSYIVLSSTSIFATLTKALA